MRNWGTGCLWLALALGGCADDGSEGQLEYTVVVEFWDFGPDRIPVAGAEVCVDDPPGECGTTDAVGATTLQVPRQSDVVVRVTHPELFPALYPITLGPDDDGRVDNLAPYSTSIVEAVAVSLGMTADPALGHVTLGAVPSSPDHVGEVITLIDPATGEAGPRSYYLGEDNLPDPGATATSSSANTVVPNVPPGEWAFDTSFAERCDVYRGWVDPGPEGEPVIRFPVRAGHVTITNVQDCAAP